MSVATRSIVTTAYLAYYGLCPECPPVREARALVFSEAFWVTAWYALLPFVVVGLVVRVFVRSLDQEIEHDRKRPR
jgi:hypothetical protein